MQNKIVEIKDLTKKYGKQVALDHVSLEIPKGHIVGLLGPNGSGKTTMIRILTSFLKDYQGEVLVNGLPLGTESKKAIAYLPDQMDFEVNMSVLAIIEYFDDMFSDFQTNKCVSLLERFEIPLKKKYKQLSKGMKEKVQLSLVMSRNADILIFDEPIAGVDPAARELVLDTILENVNDGQTIIIATHLIADIERIFDTVIFIKNGEIILNDEVDTVREQHKKSVDELFREMFKYNS